MQLLDKNGHFLETSLATQTPEPSERRSFLSKSLKLATGGVLAPTILGPTLMGVSGDAAAVVIYYLTIGGVSYKYEKISNYFMKVYRNNVYYGSAIIDGTKHTVTLANGSSKSFYLSDHRQLTSVPPVRFPANTTGGIQNTLRCAHSVFGYSKYITTGFKSASIYIYDVVSTKWERTDFNLSDTFQNEAVQKYITYVSAASKAEKAIAVANGAAAAAAIATVIAGCLGFAPYALGSALAALTARSAVALATVDLQTAYNQIQTFNGQWNFIQV